MRRNSQPKSASRIDANGRMQKFGSQEPQGVWKQKLRCSCGSSFRKYLWHKNANGTKTYGYECYRQKRNVSAAFLKRNHLDVKNVCQTKSIPAWQLDLMAKKVFHTYGRTKRRQFYWLAKCWRSAAVRKRTVKMRWQTAS